MSADYNKHSRSQSSLWELAKGLGLLEEALSGIREQTITAVKVVELGCATGGNSLGPLSLIANYMTIQATKLEVVLVDRPENPWEVLSETVTPEAILGAAQHHTKMSRGDAHRISIQHVPKCFYEICAKPSSVDLSYSFSATHWMRSTPNNTNSGKRCFAIFPTCPFNNDCHDSLLTWKSTAQIQLCDFAASRRRELKPGGRFLGSFACLESGRDSSPWSRMGKLVYRMARKRISGDQTEASLPKALADALAKGTVGTLPIAFRTQKELLGAFSKRNGWKVLRCEYAFAEDPSRQIYQMDISNSRHDRVRAVKQKYAQATMDSWKAACLEGLVGSTVAEDGISQKMARDFWQSVCDDCVGTMVREDGCDDVSFQDQYNLGIPAYFLLAERLF